MQGSSNVPYRKFEPKDYLEGHKVQPNLVIYSDDFLRTVYHYWSGKGFWPIFLEGLLGLITTSWMIALVTLLVAGVDWTLFVETMSLEKSLIWKGTPVVVICLGMAILYWFQQFIGWVGETRTNLKVRRFYSETLKLNESALKTLKWNEVTNRMVEQSLNNITSLQIVNRIMREDNFFIAMINQDVLPLFISIPGISSKETLTQSLYLSLQWVIFGYLFVNDPNKNFKMLRRELFDGAMRPRLVSDLRRRAILMGLATLLLSPFVFGFVLIFSIFKYGEQLRNSPSSVLGREWSSSAQWKFREYNELPHLLKRRLRRAYLPSVLYVSCFPLALGSVVGQFASFLCGSVMVCLLVLGVVHNDILVNGDFFGLNGLWLMGVLGGVVAVSRGLIPDDNAVQEPEEFMTTIMGETHYFPRGWKGRVHTYDVLGDFTQLFQSKWLSFVQEVLGVVLTPFVLLLSYDTSRMERIVSFFERSTEDEKDLGHVYGEALLLKSVRKSTPELGTADMKVAQSVFNFYQTYPEVQEPEEAQAMRENILQRSTFLAPSMHNPLAQTTIVVDNSSGNGNNHNNNGFPQQSPFNNLTSNVIGNNQQINNNNNNNKMEQLPSISPRSSMYLPAFSPKGSALLPVGPHQVREEQISHFNRTLLQTWVDGDFK